MSDSLSSQIDIIMANQKLRKSRAIEFFAESDKNIASTIGEESEIPEEDCDSQKGVVKSM